MKPIRKLISPKLTHSSKAGLDDSTPTLIAEFQRQFLDLITTEDKSTTYFGHNKLLNVIFVSRT